MYAAKLQVGQTTLHPLVAYIVLSTAFDYTLAALHLAATRMLSSFRHLG
jgi:hypothetical protein